VVVTTVAETKLEEIHTTTKKAGFRIFKNFIEKKRRF
jgi:hypothetical protein